MCRQCVKLVCCGLVVGAIWIGAARADDPSLVGWWPFEEASGILHDQTANHNDGTPFKGVLYRQAGKIGYALGFNGVDSYVQVADNPSLNVAHVTMAMWLQFNTIPFPNQIALNKEQQYRMICAVADTKRLSIRYRTTDKLWSSPSGDSYAGILVGTTELQAHTWYHAAAAYDGANWKLYLNGKLDGSRAETGDLNVSTNPLYFGCYKPGGYQFNGLMDDVRIYNRALTETEIQRLATPLPVASSPSPADGATDVPRDAVLSWTAGECAARHDVYFGKSFDDVNNASRPDPRGVRLSQDQVANTCGLPQVLQYGETYYWRVDEVNAPPDLTIFKGDVWQYTVEPVAYPIGPVSITATASSSNSADEGPEKTIKGSGLDAEGLHSTANPDMWLSSMTGAQPTWIQYEFDKTYELHQMWVWNHNSLLEPSFGLGVKETIIEYSTDGAHWVRLGATHEFARASGAPGYAHNTVVDFGDVAAKAVRITVNSNWGGFVPQYGLSEVRFLYVPVWAREVKPADGASGVNPATAVLSWRAGREADSHQVYVSTDQQAVVDGAAPMVPVSKTSYAPELMLDQTYYWRVDELNSTRDPAVWPGTVQSFTTADSVLIDDFESYTADEGNRLYETWADGWDDPQNGSRAGYADAPFVEVKITHNGGQSLPLFYGLDGAAVSEATRTFAPAMDWSKHGIRVLSLFVRGDPNNTGGQLYVKINGVKVSYDGDAAALLKTARWTHWDIDLSAASLAPSSIKTVTLGLAGGSGTLYVDDVRLCPAAPPEPALVGYFPFDGDTAAITDAAGGDSGSKSMGAAKFVNTAKLGAQALLLDGSGGAIGSDAGFPAGNADVTFSLWFKDETPGVGVLFGYGNPTSSNLGSVHGFYFNTAYTCRYFHQAFKDVPFNAAATYDPAKWHHVVCVHDGTSEYIYWDGKQVTVIRGGQSMNVALRQWTMGINVGGSGYGYSGLLDDVAVWNYGLSDADIARLWNNGTGLPADKL